MDDAAIAHKDGYVIHARCSNHQTLGRKSAQFAHTLVLSLWVRDER
jgi:hypothetical protein